MSYFTSSPDIKTLSYRVTFSSGSVIECGDDYKRAKAYAKALKQRHIAADAMGGKWWAAAEEIYVRGGKTFARTMMGFCGLDADLSNPLLNTGERLMPPRHA